MRLEPFVFRSKLTERNVRKHGGNFLLKNSEKLSLLNLSLSKYIIVKESKFMIKPNTRSKLGRKTA